MLIRLDPTLTRRRVGVTCPAKMENPILTPTKMDSEVSFSTSSVLKIPSTCPKIPSDWLEIPTTNNARISRPGLGYLHGSNRNRCSKFC